MPDRTHTLPRWAADVLAQLPPLLSRDHAARVSTCSRKTIDRRVREGVLKSVRNGKRVLFRALPSSSS